MADPNPAPAAPSGPALAGPALAPARGEEARLRAARTLFGQLKKNLKQLALHPGEPARVFALAKTTLGALGPLLQAGPLVLAVAPEALAVEREPVWPAEGPEDLPGLLARDGMRQLILLPGLTEEEVSRLLALLALRADVPREPLFSALFDADLEHVGLALSDAYSLGEAPESQVALETARVLEDVDRRLAHVTADLRAQSVAIVRAMDQRLEAMEDPGAPYFAGGHVSPAFCEKVRQDQALDATQRMDRLLAEHVLAQVRAGTLADPTAASAPLAGLIDRMLDRGDLAPLGGLLGALPPPVLAALGARLSEEPRLRKLVALLSRPEPDYPSLARYLAECKAAAAPVLVDLLPTIEQPGARSLLLEAIAVLDKNAGQILSDRLETEGALVVTDLLALVERLPAADRSRLFEKAIRHASSEVRIEALKALSLTKTPEAMHRFVLDATTDAEERVRAEAFRSLVKLSRVRAAQDLLRLPKLPDWDKRPHAEKELIFVCLGRTETDEAFRFAAGLLQQPKKGLFGHKRVEMKLLAVRALQEMPSLQSFKLLQGVGAMPDQDAEATAAAGKAAAFVKEALLHAESRAAAAAPPATEQPAGLAAALEHLRARLASRQPAPPPAPAPVAPAAAAGKAEAGDDLLDYSGIPDPEAPKAPAPPWAVPGTSGPPRPKGGGS